jgi:hypothetical protein
MSNCRENGGHFHNTLMLEVLMLKGKVKNTFYMLLAQNKCLTSEISMSSRPCCRWRQVVGFL